MSISNITQWLATSTTDNAFSSMATWQIAGTIIVATVALPTIVKLATGYCKKPALQQVNMPPAPIAPPNPVLFHKWYLEGKEIRFFREADALRVEVWRTHDNFKLVDSYLNLLPPSHNSPTFLKMRRLTKEFEPSGWDANGFPRIVSPTSEHHHTWLLGNQSISLISKAGVLFWKFSDQGATHWTPVTEFPQQNKEQRLQQLIDFQQPLGWNPNTNSPELTKALPKPTHWPLSENRKLSLTIRQEQPMWKLINNSLHTTSWKPINPNLLGHLPLRDRIARLECQTIDPNNTLIGTREIENLAFQTKNRHASRFDPNITFDSNQYAVTLIDSGQYAPYEMTTWGGHAAIVIEGIEDQLPFMQVCDLMPDPSKKPYGKISIQECPISEKVDCDGKTPTWLMTKDKVKRMVDAMKKERDEPANFPVRFYKYGADSLFRKPGIPVHNCITWASEKLSMVDVTCKPGLFPGFFGKLFTAPKFYTQ
jgi:hypothetical protein